jgi:hypothetical protein
VIDEIIDHLKSQGSEAGRFRLSRQGVKNRDTAIVRESGKAISSLQVMKEIVGIHALPIRSLFGDGIPRRLLRRVSPAKPTSVPLRF